MLHNFKIGDRVKCIDDHSSSTITVNKLYDVINVYYSGIVIINDINKISGYLGKKFTIDKQLNRNETIDNILK